MFRYAASSSFRTDHDLLTVVVIDCIQLGYFVLRPSDTMTCVRKITRIPHILIIIETVLPAPESVGFRFLKVPLRCVRWASKFVKNVTIWIVRVLTNCAIAVFIRSEFLCGIIFFIISYNFHFFSDSFSWFLIDFLQIFNHFCQFFYPNFDNFLRFFFSYFCTIFTFFKIFA